VVGGPLFQLLLKAHLCNAALKLAHRRVMAAILIGWAPLVLLSALEGRLFGHGLKMPFLYDIAANLRFLVVAPLLILSELVVHRWMGPIVDQFEIRRLVPARQRARFADAVDDARRLRNSVPVELVLLAVVVVTGVRVTLRQHGALGEGTWQASAGGPWGLSAAGLWLAFVSLPLMQFLLLRWYFRLLIWARFLWRMSRLDLEVTALHPDRAGGLGFLAESLIAFAPLAAAHGLLVTGVLADRIFFAGAKLTQFQVEVFGGAMLLLLLFAGPLTIFAPMLDRARRNGLREYGALGQTYARDFHGKWMEGRTPGDEPLVGSGDIQSLADLGNSYGTAQQMRIFPINPTALVLFLGAFLCPILPLLLTMMPLEKLISSMLGAVF
jgi:hypothetical protein